MEKNNKNLNQFAQIKDIIEDVRMGEMVIIVDDEEREILRELIKKRGKGVT